MVQKCAHNQLSCNTTGLCVATSQICDFTDDCLDGTDENPAFCIGYKNCDDYFSGHVPGYCSLDEGLCGWVNVDNPEGFNWISNTAITISFYTGPETDHTSGKGIILPIFPFVICTQAFLLL